MSTLEDLARRVEHLLVRHAELQRTHHLLQAQVQDLTAERDALRQRLGTARSRLDALIARIPPSAQAVAEEATPGGEG